MTWRPEQQPACAQCGNSLEASPSDDFCSDGCQIAWHSKGASHKIVRPRIVREQAPHVPPATWPTMPIPHPAGGSTYARSQEEYQRYLEDTAPVEEPPQPASPFGFTEFGQHTPPPSIIRRILNATNRKAM